MARDAYTGLSRRKQTHWSVKFGDAFVSRLIAIGGIGTIAAILLVVLVLVGTALPLFRSPQVATWQIIPNAATPSQNTPADSATNSAPGAASGGRVAYRHVGLDENGLLLWGLLEDGTLEVRSASDGRVLLSSSVDLPQGVTVTATQALIDSPTLVLGLSDGSFRTAQVKFSSTLISPSELPAQVVVTASQPVASFESTVFEWFDSQGVRQVTPEPPTWSSPHKLADAAVSAIDYLPSDSANLLSGTNSATVAAVVGEELVVARIESKRNRLTKKTTESIEVTAAALQRRNPQGRPLQLTIMASGQDVVAVWPNGTLDRYAFDETTPRLIESRSAAVQREIRAATPLLGRQTLMCGLDDGHLQGWMLTRAETADQAADSQPASPSDSGYQLTLAHEVRVGERPIESIASSRNSHVAVTCDDRSQVGLVYVTTDTLLVRRSFPPELGLQQVEFGPSSQLLVAGTAEGYATAQLQVAHPEASWRGYFGKVWYEGHDQPKYIWQSSAATQQSEIKLSLMPLVFGTLKATFYAMLISVPLALLSAIYTSEFLPPHTRGRIKPAIEMMASLPSVVLGYVAALIIAPLLQAHLMTILLALVIVPWTYIFVGHLWNLLPVEKMVRFQGWRLPGLLACLPLAAGLTILVSPMAERWLFEGSLVDWLSGSGRALGGWFLLLLPSLILLWSVLVWGPLSNWQRSLALRCSPGLYALLALAKLCVTSVALVLLAWGVAWLLDSLGLDARGQLFDNYQDRNALLVGFALGFCVIPIIYTISDDALQSVPKQLRSASLGCGATPWQTTMRIVVPSAMSGLFSAVMIGLGRAVGETMVVLCAAGNTPLMEFNIFNGFKTLSAALATELPEAAKGSTHFRTLFLAAVLLFFMTLVINTLAEFVRIRFRKRASQL